MNKSGPSDLDDDYLWNKRGEDADVARLEQLLAPLAHSAPLDELRLRKQSRLPVFLIGGLLVAAAIVTIIVWPRQTPPPSTYACSAQARGFAFTARGGSVGCGGANVPAGVLPVGGTLDTGAHEAELAIADIGTARLSPETRVRLDATSTERHQLYLERGKMHAFVNAPPRLFAVGTPSGQVTDLGCAYTLEVDEAGAGMIEVESGMVEVEAANGQMIVIPAGASARLMAGRRASLPLVKGAGAQLVAAVAQLHAGVAGARDRILTAAQRSDAITVANLARVVAPDERRTVLDRLSMLFPPPQGMSVEDVERLDLFDRWFDEVVFAQIAAH
jgi:hypothetical protein